MEEIDITQFKPQKTTDVGQEVWDAKEFKLKMVAEKVNEIIRFLNKDK